MNMDEARKAGIRKIAQRLLKRIKNEIDGDAEGLPLKPCGSPILFHWDLAKPSIHNVALAINLAGQPQVMHPKQEAP